MLVRSVEHEAGVDVQEESGCGTIIARRLRPMTTTLSAAFELQTLLDKMVAAGAPGVSAAMATRRGVVWTGVAGMANLLTGERMRYDSLLGIGSITKTFIAVVILQLVEEGHLCLDSTAESILGWEVIEGIANAETATIAQLLNHTSGIRSWENDPKWIMEGRGALLDVSKLWGRRDPLAYIKGSPPLAGPGEKYSYSNTNYTLLGLIVEKATRDEAVNAIRERILTPLALSDIYLEAFEAVPQNRLARRYHWATDDFREAAGISPAFPQVRSNLIDASSSNLSPEWAAGGMVATARDLSLYGVALRDGVLLAESSMRFMMMWKAAGTAAGVNIQIGHNLFREQFANGLVLIGHTGNVLGYTAALYWIENFDAVVSILCNVGSMHSGTVPISITSSAKSTEFMQAVLKLHD